MSPPAAQLSVCDGCCCGHPEKGNPAIDRKRVAAAVQRAAVPGLSLVYPYCLGPCASANVVRVQVASRFWTFGRINSDAELEAVLSFARDPSEERLTPLLRAHLLAPYSKAY